MAGERGEMIVYRREGVGAVQLRASGGTVWLSQWAPADLYATSVQNIQQIIARVLEDGEVLEATINSELIVRPEGARQVRREVIVYSLDMILAVGYRVTTPQSVAFRQWATTVLKEYLVKGFAMDDEGLLRDDPEQAVVRLLADHHRRARGHSPSRRHRPQRGHQTSPSNTWSAPASIVDFAEALLAQGLYQALRKAARTGRCLMARAGMPSHHPARTAASVKLDTLCPFRRVVRFELEGLGPRRSTGRGYCSHATKASHFCLEPGSALKPPQVRYTTKHA